MFIALLALVLLIIVTAIAFPIGVFKMFYQRKVRKGLDEFAAYFKRVAISIDQLGNVSGFSMLSFAFIKDAGYPFGDEDETISYVLKVNKEEGTLQGLGKPLYWLIDTIDKGHFDNLTD